MNSAKRLSLLRDDKDFDRKYPAPAPVVREEPTPTPARVTSTRPDGGPPRQVFDGRATGTQPPYQNSYARRRNYENLGGLLGEEAEVLERELNRRSGNLPPPTPPDRWQQLREQANPSRHGRQFTVPAALRPPVDVSNIDLSGSDPISSFLED